jgi:hypothetical protein
MLRGIWDRLTGRRRNATVEHEAGREQMSRAEREFVEESVDEHEADELAAEHLGGIDPDRLLPGDKPPREDRPPTG